MTRTALPAAALAAMLALTAAADPGAVLGGALAASGVSQSALPKAEELFAKYVEALGGEKAVKGVTYRITDGTLERKDAKGNVVFLARVTIWQEAPQKMRAVIEQPGVVTLEFGYDGTTAWSIDSRRGARIMEGAEREQAIDSALFLGDADHKARYKSVETVEETTFGGKPAIKVRCTPVYGTEISYVFFDPQTNLILGTENEPKPGPDGKTEPKTTTLISDYKKFGDMFFPTKITQSRADGEPLVTTYRSIEVNPKERAEIKAPEKKAEPATPAPPAPAKK